MGIKYYLNKNRGGEERMHGQLWRDQGLTDLYVKPYICNVMKPSGEQLSLVATADVTCGG